MQRLNEGKQRERCDGVACVGTEIRWVWLEEIEIERGDSEVGEKMRIRHETADTIGEIESVSTLEETFLR